MRLVIFSFAIFFSCWGVFGSPAIAGMQQVSLYPEVLEASAGEVVECRLVYRVIEDSTVTTGSGFRIHFNSKVIKGIIPQDILQEGLVGEHFEVRNDDQDFDNDPQTDKFIVFAWFDIYGNWPSGYDTLMQLGNLIIQLNGVIPVESSKVNISKVEAPVGYELQGSSAIINIF